MLIPCSLLLVGWSLSNSIFDSRSLLLLLLLYNNSNRLFHCFTSKPIGKLFHIISKISYLSLVRFKNRSVVSYFSSNSTYTLPGRIKIPFVSPLNFPQGGEFFCSKFGKIAWCLRFMLIPRSLLLVGWLLSNSISASRSLLLLLYNNSNRLFHIVFVSSFLKFYIMSSCKNFTKNHYLLNVSN